MKKQVFVFLSISMVLAACGGDTETAENKTQEAIMEEVSEPVVAEYLINSETSSATWARTLDQKPTKQKIKMFGKMVDVDLGAVKLNTNGSVSIKDGGLTTTDDEITEATIIFDMASFKFAQEKGQGLFDVTQHPNSTLVLNSFSDSSATGNLTIQETTNEVEVNLSTIQAEGTYTLTGNFTVNTLDFPLRTEVKAKDINKDEIKVSFELIYGK